MSLFIKSHTLNILPFDRDEEYVKLSAEFEKQPKVASRRSYNERIKEITKNSRKQDADIERILKETREVQLESNTIQERLHRTYAVADEIIFRYAFIFIVASTTSHVHKPIQNRPRFRTWRAYNKAAENRRSVYMLSENRRDNGSEKPGSTS